MDFALRIPGLSQNDRRVTALERESLAVHVGAVVDEPFNLDRVAGVKNRILEDLVRRRRAILREQRRGDQQQYPAQAFENHNKIVFRAGRETACLWTVDR